MKETLTALMILCAAGRTVPAQPMGDAAFLAELSQINFNIKSEIGSSTALRSKADELGKDDAVRMVLANLAGSGVPADYVQAAFADPAARIIPDIAGRFKPAGRGLPMPYDHYRANFITQTTLKLGTDFYAAHKELLDRIEQAYGVDAGILTALVGVETFYGAHTGTYPVFSALYTIVLEVPSHRDWAALELAEWLKLCYRDHLSPHAVKGSYAGAFGFFQFMPSSFNRFAVDFDGDGRIAFDQWPDVLASVANYLKAAGWETGGGFDKPGKNYASLFAYNHSDNYVRAIVELRSEILKRSVLAGNQDYAGRN